jgi:hypothetical protein
MSLLLIVWWNQKEPRTIAQATARFNRQSGLSREDCGKFERIVRFITNRCDESEKQIRGGTMLREGREWEKLRWRRLCRLS